MLSVFRDQDLNVQRCPFPLTFSLKLAGMIKTKHWLLYFLSSRNVTEQFSVQLPPLPPRDMLSPEVACEYILLISLIQGRIINLSWRLSHLVLSCSVQFSSVQFSCSVVSNSLRPHESQHARPPRPSSTPGIHSNSRPSSQWCHPVISSSVVPFSSCPQPLPASESFPMSQLFAAGGQSTGVSALASFLPENTQDWSPLECTVPRSCPTLCNPTDCSLLGSSVHVILQARILEWIAISSSRGSSWPRDWTRVSRIVDRRFTIWATRKVHYDRKWHFIEHLLCIGCCLSTLCVLKSHISFHQRVWSLTFHTQRDWGQKTCPSACLPWRQYC